jgi:hypothetical protein
MKTKKVERKLTLNKKTIARLNQEELNNFKGGVTETRDLTKCISCTVCFTNCTCTLPCRTDGISDCQCPY